MVCNRFYPILSRCLLSGRIACFQARLCCRRFVSLPSRVLLILLWSAWVSAAPFHETALQGIEAQASRLTTTELADAWQLSEQDWATYTQGMQSQAGRWYEALDPPEVLGLLSESAQDRQRWAALVVQQQVQRIAQELAFQQAVDAAWARLFPDLLPVDRNSIQRMAQAQRKKIPDREVNP